MKVGDKVILIENYIEVANKVYTERSITNTSSCGNGGGACE